MLRSTHSLVWHALTCARSLSRSLMDTCRCEAVETEVAHMLSETSRLVDVNTSAQTVSVDPQWGFPDETFVQVIL